MYYDSFSVEWGVNFRANRAGRHRSSSYRKAFKTTDIQTVSNGSPRLSGHSIIIIVFRDCSSSARDKNADEERSFGLTKRLHPLYIVIYCQR
jgi:hypothetical protein